MFNLNRDDGKYTFTFLYELFPVPNIHGYEICGLKNYYLRLGTKTQTVFTAVVWQIILQPKTHYDQAPPYCTKSASTISATMIT